MIKPELGKLEMKTAIVVLGLVPIVSGLALQASPGIAQVYPFASHPGGSSLSIPSSYPESQYGRSTYGFEDKAPVVIFEQVDPTLENLSDPRYSSDSSFFYSEDIYSEDAVTYPSYIIRTNRAVVSPGIFVPDSYSVPSITEPAYSPDQLTPHVGSPQPQFSRVTIVGSSQPGVGRLDGQLLQATCNQNWQQALQVVDQALRSAPPNSSTYRTTLQAYRDRLQSLASRQTFVPNWQQQCKGS